MGCSDATNALGYIYANVLEKKDLLKAKKMFEIAKQRGNDLAIRNLEELVAECKTEKV